MRYYWIIGLGQLLAGCGKPSRPFNVVFLSIEDAMPSFGCYGDSLAYTPNVDQFARESVLFTDVHCQVPLCTPSRTSLLTGVRPSTSGIVKIDEHWRDSLPHARSLPRHFRENGYHTTLVGKIHDYRCGGMAEAYDRVFEIHGVKENDLVYRANGVQAPLNPTKVNLGALRRGCQSF